jgi:co-chaperonin GroES (HSP10)
MRPTGHRILIQPDEQPTHSDLVLLPEHRDFVATSGVVVAMGPRGSKVRYEARQRALRDAVDALSERWGPAVVNAVVALIGSPDTEHEIKVGDRVAFDSESGLRVCQDGVEYLIMDEDAVVVIVEETEAVA